MRSATENFHLISIACVYISRIEAASNDSLCSAYKDKGTGHYTAPLCLPMAIVTRVISLVYDWIIHKGDSGERNIWAKF